MASAHQPAPTVVPPHSTHSRRPSTTERRRHATSSHSQRPTTTYIPRPNNAAMSTASPEMINSLVESLSKISGPPNTNLYGTPPQTAQQSPFSSSGGMFKNVEYNRRDYPYDDDAALAPVVRTSKPPSGYSPLTRETDDRRMSYQSGVDIPSYVRNYMNRADREESAMRAKAETASRRASWSSSKKASRLSCVSSWERIKKGSAPSVKSLDGSLHERELRMSAAGILYTPGVDEIGGRYSVVEEPEMVGGRIIPTRGSSYGKVAPGITVSYPAAVVTSIPPRQIQPAEEPIVPTGKASKSNSAKEKRNQVKRRSSPPTLFGNANGVPAPVPTKNKHHSQPPAPPLSPSNFDDRPSSADSIDDAVEAYLSSPRLSQKLRMPNTGRTISFSEVGDPNGFAVFCCVGMGLTRYIMAFYDELALSLGLRLITPDRPGVGESDPIDESERTVLNWPDDVLYICQALKITKFSLLAHSAGAIYALATALRMVSHIRGRIHLLAPWIPPSQMTAMETQLQGANGTKGGKVGTLPTAQRILRALPTPILKVANSSFMSATSSSLTTSLPRNPQRRRRNQKTDNRDSHQVGLTNTTNVGENGSSERESSGSSGSDGVSGSNSNQNTGKKSTFSEDLSNEEAAMLRAAAAAAADKERQLTYDERLTHAIWTLATRGANPAIDLLVCLERTRPVGFRYVDIMKPVVIHHGVKDNRVPVENVRWLGKTMRRCEVRELKSEGHGLMASAAVMGSVLQEIADEWREWTRLTEGMEGRSRSGTVNTLGGSSTGRW